MLENILTYCEEEDIDPTPDIICNILYERVMVETTSQLGRRNVDEIAAFLKMHTKNYCIFKTLCEMQTTWNATREI